MDLAKTGPHADSDDLEFFQFSYSIDSAPFELIDLVDRQQHAATVLAALVDPCVAELAFNATFDSRPGSSDSIQSSWRVARDVSTPNFWAL